LTDFDPKMRGAEPHYFPGDKNSAAEIFANFGTKFRSNFEERNAGLFWPDYSS